MVYYTDGRPGGCHGLVKGFIEEVTRLSDMHLRWTAFAPDSTFLTPD